MFHSNKILSQQTVNAAIQNGIKHVVISPGSRNAPLIIEWNAYPEIKKYSIVDERSAAFFALGIALHIGEPVALVCTSGSALLNYYPAITEAFYSDIPLLIISADRPKKLIDIGDGQTIRQENVFQNHIWFNANLTEEFPDQNIEILKEALAVFFQKKGPVHINVPFSEPLYDTTEDLIIENTKWEKHPINNSILSDVPLEVEVLEKYADKWNVASKKMVIVGVSRPDEMLQIQLNHLAKDPSVIILTESTSNVVNDVFINQIDRLIFPLSNHDFETLKPDILISIGGQVVSKKIKSLLRNNPPKEHWHIDKNWKLDTFHCLTKHFELSPQLFFSQFFFLTKTFQSDYQSLFSGLNSERIKNHEDFFKNIPFSDLKVYEAINAHLPLGTNTVFSNSASIRYAQFFDWKKSPFMTCNRGTSGIDGSTSTAIGFAVVSNIPTLFITGDLSFFYDSNALWINCIPNNFRMIVVNNGGGGIFRFIPGPTTTNTLDFFETSHNLSAKHLCEMYHIDYVEANDGETLSTAWENFYNLGDKPKLLEIFTPRELNAEILKNYFNSLK